MKNLFIVFIAIMSFAGCQSGKESMHDLIADRLARSAEQYALMAASLRDQPDKLPRSTDAAGNLITSGPNWWCSGYFPGSLWYLYEYSDNEKVLEDARHYTARVEAVKNDRSQHDIGLMLYCSFGNGYRLTGDTAYRDVLLTGAESLSSRFNPKVGCIQSWNENKERGWQYPVIIDNMMCLELLLWASKESGDPKYGNQCISHAEVTIRNHFRPDYSSYHVVSYDTITGQADKKNTHQGFSDDSAWARGQAWGLYGYTMMYRETHKPEFLEQATHIAAFLLNHPHLPADKIPYWDFNAPDIPASRRDASSAAIMASALVELSGYVDEKSAQTYLEVAQTQIRTLSSAEYFAETGTNGYFILKHSVGHLPANSEVDVPLTYADYYYIEALTRYQKLLDKNTLKQPF
ncbi:MAG: Unsaturated glucuronyl hydrolase [Candidatus Ordinivivax streblomastigis]|uniref:Unsaturated glucuronyl hydrolase n=1 Tax=Candidatus Ordinivivax streblomastigis TaxID=2540710 RepID=A0A5M8NYB6_9BACT|nr:MAG: Unsaturated glucuronyl hydrolase [Candidatus Ordinivivax streblomastigis]